MADVDYNIPYEFDITVPPIVLNNDQMQAVIQWFCANVITSHPLADDIPAHFEMDWIHISDEKFTALRTASPNLSYIRRTVHGARMFLQIMENSSEEGIDLSCHPGCSANSS